MYLHRIPVPLEFKLPHGWHLSHVGFAVPLPPAGLELRSLIEQRRPHMSSTEYSLSDNAPTSSRWRERFNEEHAIEIARLTGHETGRYNVPARRAW